MAEPDDERSSLPLPVVPPDVYDDEYFRQCCAGAAEWSASGGREVAPVYRVALQRAGFRPGAVVVDVGTGRGELPVVAAEMGAARAFGVEYSAAAIELAYRTAEAHGATDRVEFILADARSIPVPSGFADLVTMLDVVEHLAQPELDRALAEAHRMLRPGGNVLIHTFPTRTIYNVTYRVLRWSHPAWRRRWPVDPRNDYERLLHINEQSVSTLRRALRRAGFARPNVKVGLWVYTEHVPAASAKRVYHALARVPVLRPLGVSNIWAEATKAL